MKLRNSAVALALLAASCTHPRRTAPTPSAAPPAAARGPAAEPLVPVADYHTHLVSPVTAKLGYEPPLPPVAVPGDVAQLLRKMERGWNDTLALARLLTDDAVALNLDDTDLPSWIVGRAKVASFLAGRFGSAYRVTPVAYRADGSAAQVAGYFTRGDGPAAKHVGHVFLSLARGGDDGWRIAAETPAFPGPFVFEPVSASQLVTQLDDAGIRRAVVLSVAYWYGSAWAPPVEHEYEKVRAENDWVAAQVAQFPDRLVAFCSFNPLKDYAVEELDRCAKNPVFKGIKLHFGNSAVDVRKPDHLERVRRVFRAANARHLAIVVHLWTGPEYETEGAQHARGVLSQLLPAAPDVPVQIAHMAGGGRSTDSALRVFAEAVAAGDPRTKNLYFDVATLTEGESAEGLRRDAMRMRQIGLHRILYGTDTSPPQPPQRVSWALFRALVPLTDDELRTIAANVAPYVR